MLRDLLPFGLFSDLSRTGVGECLSSKGFSLCKVNRRNGDVKSDPCLKERNCICNFECFSSLGNNVPD